MVRQVKRIGLLLVALLITIAATCGTVSAATHNVYENGSLSSTYITYFKDILSGCSINDNYVAFRSGQYEYTMIVGDLENNNGVISLSGNGKQYRYYTTSSNYNSQYYYDVTDISSFSLNTGNSILYTDIGDYPELVERGAKYEIISAILISIFLLSCVIWRIFNKR